MRRAGGGAPGEASKAKARKTIELWHTLPHTSASAMTKFVERAQANDLGDVSSSRRSLLRASEAYLEKTDYGEMIVKVDVTLHDGSSRPVLMINPFAYLARAFETDGGFHRMCRAAFLKEPPTIDTKWDIILYSDEVTPGNVLSTSNKRKVWACYWTYKQWR